MYRSLKKLGAVVDVVVPHRIEDGYGINENLLRKPSTRELTLF